MTVALRIPQQVPRGKRLIIRSRVRTAGYVITRQISLTPLLIIPAGSITVLSVTAMAPLAQSPGNMPATSRRHRIVASVMFREHSQTRHSIIPVSLITVFHVMTAPMLSPPSNRWTTCQPTKIARYAITPLHLPAPASTMPISSITAPHVMMARLRAVKHRHRIMYRLMTTAAYVIRRPDLCPGHLITLASSAIVYPVMMVLLLPANMVVI